jgi:hypothetical protein
MKKNRRPIQRSLDILAPVPAPVPIVKTRGLNELVGEPFVSPIARIRTNPGLLIPSEKPR